MFDKKKYMKDYRSFYNSRFSKRTRRKNVDSEETSDSYDMMKENRRRFNSGLEMEEYHD